MPETLVAPVLAISETRANMRLAHQAANHYHVTISAETDPEELLNPGFWKHLAPRFKKDWQNNRTADILAVCENRSWRWELEVRDVGPYHIKVLPLRDICWYDPVTNYRSAQPVAAEVSTDIRVRFTPGAGWIVQRQRDKEMLAKGLANRDAAEAWLANYLTKIAA